MSERQACFVCVVGVLDSEKQLAASLPDLIKDR